MRKKIILGTIVALGLFVYIPGIRVLRYRLTITAACDGREVSGSSVINTRWNNVIQRYIPLLANSNTGNRISVETQGEATVVDLCSHGKLLALLTSDPRRHFSNEPPNFVSNTVYGGGDVDSGPLDPDARNPDPINLPLDHLPLLIWLPDTNNTSEIRIIDPDEPPPRFSENVRILRASLQLVSPGIWPLYFSASPVAFR